MCAFVVPNDFMLGGSNGIALALQTWLPLPLSALSAILNGFLFLLGWIFMGKQFAATSLLSTVIYPILMAVFEALPIGTLFQTDKLTCAIFCSLIMGLGIGIVVREDGSTGGMDIPPCILQKYKGIPVGTSLMVSMTVNQTVITGVKKVQIIIISPAYEQIRQEILGHLDSGATMLDIETGYEGQSQKAVFCVVYAKRYPAVRDAALKLDPKTFIVTTDVKNVNGRGYTLSRTLDTTQPS